MGVTCAGAGGQLGAVAALAGAGVAASRACAGRRSERCAAGRARSGGWRQWLGPERR
jgi:hypothetical protein